MYRRIVLVCLLMFVMQSFYGQNQKATNEVSLKNQLATNLFMPLFESFDIGYERTVANKWAVGISGAVYGEPAQELLNLDSYYDRIRTQYELIPYGRVYFQGARKKSHFVEFFGSLSWVEEMESFLRNTTVDGFGVYERGKRNYTVGGLGAGYGYRFLFLNDRLVLEGQIGIRTNFDVEFLGVNVAPVRTGIRVGYRF